ncbi:MAG: hypothetical protein QW165_04580 [Candidatus Woesearchaeota archaeon]
MMETIIGLGIVAFLFLYIILNLNNEEHFFFKLMLIFFFLIILFLIPKAALDAKKNCQTVLANITDSPPNHLYSYTQVCNTTTTRTEGTFWKVLMWFIGFTATYFIVYTLWFFAQKSKRFMDSIARLKSKWRG